jgi:hypothetical protein
MTFELQGLLQRRGGGQRPQYTHALTVMWIPCVLLFSHHTRQAVQANLDDFANAVLNIWRQSFGRIRAQLWNADAVGNHLKGAGFHKAHTDRTVLQHTYPHPHDPRTTTQRYCCARTAHAVQHADWSKARRQRGRGDATEVCRCIVLTLLYMRDRNVILKTGPAGVRCLHARCVMGLSKQVARLSRHAFARCHLRYRASKQLLRKVRREYHQRQAARDLSASSPAQDG